MKNDNHTSFIEFFWWPVVAVVMIAAMAYMITVAAGCSSIPSAGRFHAAALGTVETAAGGRLGVLSWVGGIALLGGIAAVVITRGTMGMRAVMIGTGLCVATYLIGVAVERYSDWIFIPVLSALGIVSIVYAVKSIRGALFTRSGAKK